MRIAISLPCLLLTACATSSSIPEFSKTGEVSYGPRSASFDDHRVLAPNMNVSRRSDGSWAGVVSAPSNTVIDVEYVDGEIRGSNISLRVTEREDGVRIMGYWLGRQMRFELDDDAVRVMTPNRQFAISRRSRGVFGPAGEFRLEGEAQRVHPPMPQFALALIAAFG